MDDRLRYLRQRRVRRGGAPDPLASVTKDASSSIYTPADATEWSTLLTESGTGVATPSALWLLQEASGNAADSIGAFTLTASGTLSYQQAVSGWSRTGVLFTDAVTGQFKSTSASLPDLSTTSCTILAFILPTASTALTRQMLVAGTTGRAEARLTTTPAVRALSGANVADGVADPTGSVRPIVLKHNVTGSAAAVYTDADKIVPTFSAGNGKTLCLGHFNVSPPTMTMLYACAWFGANAEISDANIKTILQTMGWTITWT